MGIEQMIIAAKSSEFPSIIEKAPMTFGVFYLDSSASPNRRTVSAMIRKVGSKFVYEPSANSRDPSPCDYATVAELIDRMTRENDELNGGRKCIVEF